MQAEAPETLYYKRSQFVTRLPVHYRYTAGHSWVAARGPGQWRVGLTRFATRMLGEIVDHAFDVAPGAAVAAGQVLGWVEGFKAISDIFCAGAGEFASGNLALKNNATQLSEDPYGAGWLYEFNGQPQAGCVDVQEYRAILDATIDRILAKHQDEANQ